MATGIKRAGCARPPKLNLPNCGRPAGGARPQSPVWRPLEQPTAIPGAKHARLAWLASGTTQAQAVLKLPHARIRLAMTGSERLLARRPP